MVKILEMLMNSSSAKQSKATLNPGGSWRKVITSSEAVAGSGRSAAEAPDAKATREQRSEGRHAPDCLNDWEDRSRPPSLFHTTKHPAIE